MLATPPDHGSLAGVFVSGRRSVFLEVGHHHWRRIGSILWASEMLLNQPSIPVHVCGPNAHYRACPSSPAPGHCQDSFSSLGGPSEHRVDVDLLSPSSVCRFAGWYTYLYTIFCRMMTLRSHLPDLSALIHLFIVAGSDQLTTRLTERRQDH